MSNYFLNVGPTAEGEIPAESVKLLKEVGAWMKINGESIYGTRGSPFRRLPWGRCTMKSVGGETHLYLHVLDWPRDGKLRVPGLLSPVKSAALLAGGAAVPVEKSEDAAVLTLPATAPDAVCSVVRLVVDGPPEVAEPLVAPDKDGVIRLLPADARCEGEVKPEKYDGIANLGFWINPKDSVSWNFRAASDGKYQVLIEASTPAEGSVLMVQGVGKLACSVPKTGGWSVYQTSRVGEVSLSKGVKSTLTLRPVVDS